ncbi:MAG: iron-containing redox enzyme family protein [Planctomycetes bacterium]|nr:iron-containing redox enzyme family protein [Planctomycetota bacterium]
MTTTSTVPSAQGTCDPGVEALIQESLAHPAVRHPFLTRFASGTFADPANALRTYAVEYSGYAAWFPRYLKAVISRLESPAHRELLAHNLEEEQGHLGADDCEELRKAGIDPATVQGVPHPALFRRFCDSLGIEPRELAQPCPAARRWRERFESFLRRATPAQAVGALGLGTEHIVRPVYEQLIKGILGMGTLRRDEFVFFELHCLVDDQHQQDLLEIAQSLADQPGGLAELRHGMLTALKLRCDFWDDLYSRILDNQLANPA